MRHGRELPKDKKQRLDIENTELIEGNNIKEIDRELLKKRNEEKIIRYVKKKKRFSMRCFSHKTGQY